MKLKVVLVSNLRVGPGVEPTWLKLGLTMSRPLLLFMPLHAMYVGGCYMLKQHTWRAEAGVVDGSLSGRPSLTSRLRTADEA